MERSEGKVRADKVHERLVVLAAAILDRLLHDAEVLSINGLSFRLKGRFEALGRADEWQ